MISNLKAMTKRPVSTGYELKYIILLGRGNVGKNLRALSYLRQGK